MAAAKPNHPLKTILIAGLVAGTLDGLAAVVKFYIDTGRSPQPIFRYIASAAVDKNNFSPGTLVLLGVLFHYLIAISFAAFFWVLYKNIAAVRKNIILSGILYGLFAWLVMNRIVLPLSKLAAIPFDMKGAAIAALILIFFLGLPIALLTKKLAKGH